MYCQQLVLFLVLFRRLWRQRGKKSSKIGAPGEDRTPDPKFRKLVLYPTELRAHTTLEKTITKTCFFANGGLSRNSPCFQLATEGPLFVMKTCSPGS